VIADTHRLYARLFGRSFAIAALIFGVIQLFHVFALSNLQAQVTLALLSFVLTFVGNALVEGALVEIVKDLHEDGDRVARVGDVFRRVGGRLGDLGGVSLVTGLLTGLGLMLLIVPGLVLMTRWAVAVPVVMLEGRSTGDAMRRSRELVAGNGRAVFNVLLGVGLVVGVVSLVFALAARNYGLAGLWLGGTIGAALTAPYAAHAVTVLYFHLVEPGRPVALQPGEKWLSVWSEQDGTKPKLSAREEAAWAEYERRFHT
jgi:hypothetical protein